jgi:hypothetical protein
MFGVRLTAYGGDATDLPTHILQGFLDAVATGDATVPIHRTYHLDEIAEAHSDMEAGHATRKTGRPALASKQSRRFAASVCTTLSAQRMCVGPGDDSHRATSRASNYAGQGPHGSAARAG